MAKKRKGPSRSQYIRDYLGEVPSATPNQIVDALKSRGIKVSVGLASSVKYTSGPGAKAKRKTAGRKTGKIGSTAQLTVRQLVEMKKLAQELGGIDAARKALEALETLQQ